MPDRMRVPLATYRLQLNADLTLDDAAELVAYLVELGVSDLYAEPILTRAPGASHGYHMTDPEHIEPSIGGEEAMARLGEALRARDVGLLLDIVPNHLAAHPANPWWRDVLANGPASPWARAFDVDWEGAGGRVVLPLLGAPPQEVVAAGELGVEIGQGGEPELVYYDTRLPLAPPTREHAEELAAGRPEPDQLRALLEAQHYDLRYWRTGVEELNYRRFFDITDLVGVRVEDPEVFDARHRRLLELVVDGIVTGFRVDHIDGLRDPLGYLQRLQEAARDAAGAPAFYVVVEKIVEGDEPLPEEWPVAGTTGYELLTAANSVLVDTDGLAVIDADYRRRTGLEGTTVDVLHERKLEVLRTLFHGEVSGLVRRLAALLEHVPEASAVDVDALRDALVAFTASFPVYRTYLREDAEPRAQDQAWLQQAAATARRRHPDLDGRALVALERVLGMELPVGLATEVRRRWTDVVMRWQQLTGPAMAKGFEDTTFYVVNRLVALNEVGVDAHGIDDPHGVDGFHDRVGRRGVAWPYGMNATSTHDTKRSEDVRARLDVLSELPGAWAEAFDDWHRRAAGARTELADHVAPDTNEEWSILQLLVGMWPAGPVDLDDVRQRLRTTVEKSAREAKGWTSWLDPDDEHEEALRRYVDTVTADEATLAVVQQLVGRTELPGTVNSLAQVVIRTTVPGVPDTYQGTELWDRSLVDPDNRRPVDFGRRRQLLAEIRASHDEDPAGTAAQLRDDWRDGRVKLLVTWRCLQARRAHPELFLDGRYVPLEVSGPHADRVLAFGRELDGACAVAVVPRRVAPLVEEAGGWPLGDVWEETTVVLPRCVGALRDAITGAEPPTADEDGPGELLVRELFDQLPFALLVPTAR